MGSPMAYGVWIWRELPNWIEAQICVFHSLDSIMAEPCWRKRILQRDLFLLGKSFLVRVGMIFWVCFVSDLIQQHTHNGFGNTVK